MIISTFYHKYRQIGVQIVNKIGTKCNIKENTFIYITILKFQSLFAAEDLHFPVYHRIDFRNIYQEAPFHNLVLSLIRGNILI